MSESQQSVLSFWFEESGPSRWFQKDDDFDQEVAERFGKLTRRAAACELWQWRRDPRGRLAEVIVLDQFSRNIFRDTPQAFAQDPLALALAQEAVALGADRDMSPMERAFLYMPYMHSESPRIHEVALELYDELGLEEQYDFELRHKEIIDRFGRYPHRNAILGRESTPEEQAFLQQPGSGF